MKEELSEEDLQNVTHSIMPYLIKIGFIGSVKEDLFSDTGLWIPIGRTGDPVSTSLRSVNPINEQQKV